MAAPSDTRARILEAAARLFHEQGYHATGVATIQREAGVNPGTLYHHFAAKEALLEAVLERYLTILRPAVTDHAEAASADPLERVFALLAFYRAQLQASGCKQGCPIGNLVLELADDHARVRGLLSANLDQWAGILEGWLAAAGPRLPQDLDRGALATLVLTVMEGGILQARARDALAPYDESVAQLRAYFNLLEERARAAPSGDAQGDAR